MACNDWGIDLCTGGTGWVSDAYYGSGCTDSYTGDGISYGATQVFDDDEGTYWNSATAGCSAQPRWVGYDFGEGNDKRVGRVHLKVYNSNYIPSEFTVQGSTTTTGTFDQKSWTNIYTESSPAEDAYYVFENDSSYRYVRIWVADDAAYGANNEWVVYEVEMFECQDAPPITFYFSDPMPTDSGTIYVDSQTLQLTTTVSGDDPSYTYDATFYNAVGDVQIGTTVSGVNSGSAASSTVDMTTSSAGTYSWYVTATSSGQSDNSGTYQFNKLFRCAGTVEVDGTGTSGIPVRLYRRDTGALLGEDISTGISGTFEIDTTVSGYYYAIALYATTVSGEDPTLTNALIYDHLMP